MLRDLNGATGSARVPARPKYSATQLACVGALLGAVVLLGAVLVWLGRVGWPGLHRDGALHSTPIINVNNGRGYTISVYYHAPLIYPGKDFSYHGQLYHFVFGRVLRCANYAELFGALGWLNALTVAASAACLFLHLRRGVQLSWGLATLASCAGAAGAGAVALALQGRPEQIIPLLGALAGLARFGATSTTRWLLVCGLDIALVGLASPMPGVILAGAYAVTILLTPSIRMPILAIAAMGVIALVSWLGLMQLVFPFSLAEWFATSANQGAHGFGPRGLSMVPTVWIFNSHHPLMILAPAVLALLFLGGLWRLRAQPARFVLAAAAMLGELGLWLFRGGFMYYAINYNLTGLFVHFWLISLWLLRDQRAAANVDPQLFMVSAEKSPSRQTAATRVLLSRGTLVALALIVCGFGGALGLLRQVVLSQSYVERGTSFVAADNLLKPLLPRLKSGERIAIVDSSHPSLVTLSEADNELLWLQRVDTELAELEEGLHVRIRFLVVPQLTDLAPERYGPFTLTEDYFRHGAVTVLGIRLADYPPGYQFAVYERVS